MARKSAEESAVMGAEGERVKARRLRLGMTIAELSRESGVHRDTITALEDGKGFRMDSLVKIERALAAAEVEAGIDAPPALSAQPEMVRFEVTLPEGGATVVVSGPVSDIGELTEAVRKLTRGNRQ